MAVRLENPRRWRRRENQQQAQGAGAKGGKAGADSKYSNKKVIEERVVDIGPPEDKQLPSEEEAKTEPVAVISSSLVEDRDNELSEADAESSWEDDGDEGEAVAKQQPGAQQKKQRVYCLPTLPKEEQDVEPTATKGS